MPLCFFRKEVLVDVAVDHFSHWRRSFKVLDDLTLVALDGLIKDSNGTYLGDDCQRLCIATVHCRTEQSLKIGLFVQGKYGWIVSTSERLNAIHIPLALFYLFFQLARLRIFVSLLNTFPSRKFFP